MAVIYFVITVIFLALNAGGLPGAISQVFTGAFSGTAPPAALQAQASCSLCEAVSPEASSPTNPA